MNNEIQKVDVPSGALSGCHGTRSQPAVPPAQRTFSMMLPWPPKELSPNFRTRSTRWIARVRKEYRRTCGDAVWNAGVRPQSGLTLCAVKFLPPTKAKHDDDNMRGRFKAGRDGIADALGVDDRTFNKVPHDFGDVSPGGAVQIVLTESPE